jgi:hypothetical protein
MRVFSIALASGKGEGEKEGCSYIQEDGMG